jgi:hypothetical protein
MKVKTVAENENSDREWNKCKESDRERSGQVRDSDGPKDSENSSRSVKWLLETSLYGG